MCNMGKIDRIIRAVLGLTLIIVSIVIGNVILGVIGGIALGTSAMSFCPLYSVIKLNTGCKAEA